MTDKTLLSAKRRGEEAVEWEGSKTKEETLIFLVETYSQSILRMAYVYLGDSQLAQDVMQDTFTKAWQHLAFFKGESSLQTWLMRIAINTCKDYRKSSWFKRVDHGKTLETLPEPAREDPPFDDTLINAVRALPPKEKEVILLYYYQNLNTYDIGKALNLAPSTIHRRRKKAEKRLKITLKEWYEND